jgi:dTDP-4-amino-4,6-dideoxygalactose transaminase
VVAVNNGTTALIAAVEALHLQPGDEVITSPFTFVATLNAIIAAGATARFADITESDFNIDPERIEALISDRTKVLMPVHLYGQCADMRAISRLADEHGLHIVEDAAQAHGAALDGRSAGTWGIGCFSLYATKNITSGEGGLISTNDADIADTLRVLRNQGMRQRYQYEMVGNNYRLTDIQAALCVPQLARYEHIVAARKSNAAALTAGLADVDGVVTPSELQGRSHVWHQYTVLVDAGARLDRDRLMSALTERGIGSGVYYPKTVYDYDCYRGHPQVVADEAKIADDVVQRCLSLPVHSALSAADIDRIVTTIAELMR